MDGQYTRFALCALLPLLFCVSLVCLLFKLCKPSSSDVILSVLRTADNSECHHGVGYVHLSRYQFYLPKLISFGPIAQYHENSKYYSAEKPRANKMVDNNLPHVTIQMPVYKEGLDAVL